MESIAESNSDKGANGDLMENAKDGQDEKLICFQCIHEDDIHRLLKSLLDGNGQPSLMQRYTVTEKVVEELALIVKGTPEAAGLQTHMIQTNTSFRTIKMMIGFGITLGMLIAGAYGAYFAYLGTQHKPVANVFAPVQMNSAPTGFPPEALQPHKSVLRKPRAAVQSNQAPSELSALPQQ